MASDDLTKEASLNLSIGHLLVVWDILANKMSETPFIKSLSDEERRAVWALQDLCEQGLIESGLGSRPEPEWDNLVQAAKTHVKTIPVDHLN